MNSLSHSIENSAQQDQIEQDAVLHIAFVLVPQFSFFALACCSEPFRVANRLTQSHLFKFIFLSEDGQPVMASNNIAINVDYKVTDCPKEYKTIIVISGFEPLKGSGKLLSHSLKRFAHEGACLGAVDTGAHILASAGLLNSQKAIVHWEANSGFKESFPQNNVLLERYVIEDKRMFSAGGVCCLDMMLNIIGRYCDETLVTSVAEQFTYNHIQKPDESQMMDLCSRLGSTNKILLRTVQIMEKNIELPLSVSFIAAKVNISLRELERIFKKNLQTSPKNYYRYLRLNKAKQLLSQTDMTALEISIACGFQSASYFSTAYKSEFGVSPKDDRIPSYQ